MTYPGAGGPWQPNDPNQQQPGPGSGPFPAQGGYPQQGGYQQGGYQQPGGYQQGGYQQPGYQQGGYQQQPGYQTGPQQALGYGQPGYGQPGYGMPPRKKRKGPIIGAIAAVLVIAVGVATTIIVLNRSGSGKGGEADPTAAASNLINSLSQGDVLGVLESLTPAESALLVDFNTKTTKRLQELEVYKEDADPNKLHGVSVEATNLKYDEGAEEKVNDHLTITKLVGGQVSFHSDVSELPLTDEFKAALPEGFTEAEPTDEKIDIAEVVEQSGQPIRIATVKSGDEWYPSLFYTVADYALQGTGKEWPSESIANNGASDPKTAVKEMVQAAINADLERVIELLPPDEMGALHDAGPALLEGMGPRSPAGVEVTKLETETAEATGGTKVLLKEIVVQADGETYSVVKDGDCYMAEGEGESNELCAEDLAQEMASSDLDPDVQRALTNLATGLIKNTGVVTTEVDGKWYVSPLRTYSELGITAMSELTPEDVIALVEMM